ncbi:MAG: M15 family metallopeptidase [Ruminococcus sp.]|nr:M15 family metallopeptidase [Ruminococcus sp.]
MKKIIISAFLIILIFAGAKLFKSRFNIIDKAAYTSGTTADWRLILVNSSHAVPKGYSPDLMQLSNGIYIDSRIYPDLQNMFDDARADGIYPVVGEGYRTHEQQEDIMQDKINTFIDEGYSKREAEKLAGEWVAEAGKSEHELGLALDINADTSMCTDSDVYEWLAENACKYGFILRYPSGSESITGIDYEPWHYRYVGIDNATEIYNNNITLEEYLS